MPARPLPTDAADLMLVGRIGKTHGVRGDVKVTPETDDPERFSELETVFVGPQARSFAVETVRYQHSKRGTTVLLKLAGVDTPEAAAALKGLDVYAQPEDLPPLAEDEFFLHDLVGARVVTTDGADIGTVADVLDLPAQPVCVVRRPGRPDALIPIVPAFIAELNIPDGVLIITPIEGLL